MISIAMAVFNGEKYLEKQLDSILVQLSKDDEIVVAVNPSSDNSLVILNKKAQKDNRIKVLVNNDIGLTQNFNFAISHCVGDYIYISDQDDIWLPNKIATIQGLFNDGYDSIVHDFVGINENDEIISGPFFVHNKVTTSKLRTLLKPRQSGCCMAFTKDLIKKITPIPLEIESYDQWLAYQSLSYGKVKILNEPLIQHRFHSNNVTSKEKRSLSQRIKSRLVFIKAINKK